MNEQTSTARGLSEWRDPAVEARYYALADTFRASLSPEQVAIYVELDVLGGERTTAEQDRFVEQLAEHFPGIAPAIRALTDGSHGDVSGGSCCEYWRSVR
jgi:hypothetical protein